MRTIEARRSPAWRVLLLAALLALCATPVHAAEGPSRSPWTVPRMLVSVPDVLVLRPVGVASTLMGSVAFVITLPVTWAFGKREESQDRLLVTPINQVFTRPLGEF